MGQIGDVLRRYFLEAKRRMDHVPLGNWAAARWMDMALSLEWLFDNGQTANVTQDLWALLQSTHKHGMDWEAWFTHFETEASPHGVNNAQALKSAAVAFRATGNSSLPQLSKVGFYHGYLC